MAEHSFKRIKTSKEHITLFCTRPNCNHVLTVQKSEKDKINFVSLYE